jgi:hypothetical protein
VNPIILVRDATLLDNREEALLRRLYANALHDLVQENPRRWRRVSEVYVNRSAGWADKFIAHNKRMADKGIPNAVELVARVTALRMKA